MIEILLLYGSEKFISVATNEKELISELAFHQNTEGKQNKSENVTNPLSQKKS